MPCFRMPPDTLAEVRRKHPHVASRRPYARIHIGFTLAPSDRYQAGTTFGTTRLEGPPARGEN